MRNDPATDETAPAAAASLCRHLRSSGMYVHTDGWRVDTDEDGHSTHCWCLKTMKDFGPDQFEVGVHECRDPSRPCYEPT